MDREVIDQKLESLRRCLARVLSSLPASPDALATNIDAQDIIALNLTRAVQVCVDIATHWLSTLADAPSPTTMGNSFVALAQAGAIPHAMALTMRRAVGFRNVVVHNYESIDWYMVYALCSERLDDFRAFAALCADECAPPKPAA